MCVQVTYYTLEIGFEQPENVRLLFSNKFHTLPHTFTPYKGAEKCNFVQFCAGNQPKLTQVWNTLWHSREFFGGRMVGYSQMVSTIFTTSSPLLHQFFVGSLPLLRWFFTVIFFPFQSTHLYVYIYYYYYYTCCELHCVSYSGVFKKPCICIYVYVFFLSITHACTYM